MEMSDGAFTYWLLVLGGALWVIFRIWTEEERSERVTEEARVETELVDLSEASLAETWGDDEELAAAKRRLLGRVDNPKSSFGGYNPQRDEEGEGSS